MEKETEIKFELYKPAYNPNSEMGQSAETFRYGKYITHSVYGTTAQTATNYGIMFIARHPIEVMRITETHAVAGSDAGAVTLDVKKAGSGVAIASGTTLLSSTFNLKSTANTPVIKEGIDLSNSRVLIEGDRIGLVATGTLTALSDVHITIYYKEINQGYIR
ncbi:MAG TPA: hypothetical protein PLW71_00970 [Candidatus Syntrophosphaera thermopropionivorans]|nr:hypothetical protein [Candidatus Syntrophosphaera thermopropionivorans]